MRLGVSAETEGIARTKANRSAQHALRPPAVSIGRKTAPVPLSPARRLRSRGRLCVDGLQDGQGLDAMVRAAALVPEHDAVRSLQVQRERCDRPLTLLVVSAHQEWCLDWRRAVAVVLASDPRRNPGPVASMLTQLYRLTKTEARIAEGGMNGQWLRHVALELSIGRERQPRSALLVVLLAQLGPPGRRQLKRSNQNACPQ